MSKHSSQLKLSLPMLFLVLSVLSFCTCDPRVEAIDLEVQKSLIASVLDNSKSDNFNEDIVIKSFEQLHLTDSICMQIQSAYLDAAKSKFGLEEGFARVDSILNKWTCPECKLKAYTNMGQNFYARGVGDLGLNYYKKAVEQNKENKFNGSKYLTAAEGFINGIENLQLGMKVDGFQSTDINGVEIDLENTEGKIVLIDFWATWCKPCKADLPMLQSIFKKYGDRDDFEMISISQDKDIATLNEYLAEGSMPWTHIYENLKIESQLAKQFNAFILPTYYVFDKNGNIQYNFTSRRNGQNLEETVDKLFNSPS